MGYIYKITNTINNKVYIGKTELIPPEKRWDQHKKDCRKHKNEKRPLYDAMNKYGIENFCFEVIEETNDACEREKYYIEKYRSYVGFNDSNGYNATLGGDGKPYLELNEEDVVYCYKYIYNLNSVETAKYFGVDPKTIRNIIRKFNLPYLDREASKSLPKYLEKGIILQIDLSSNLIINKYLDLCDMERNSEYKKDHVRSYINGYYGTHKYKGYLWYYYADLPDEIKKINNIK